MWEFCERSVDHLFGASTGDAVADGILCLVRQAVGGATRSDISNFLGRNVASGRISAALAALVKGGLARCERRTDTGGRPAEVWPAAGGKP